MLSKLSKKHTGILFGLLAGIAFASYVTTNRYVYTTYPDVQVFEYTVTFLSAGGLFAAAASAFNYKELLELRVSKSSLRLALNGIFAGLGLAIFITGQGFTSATNASILATSTAVTTALFSYFLLGIKLQTHQIRWMAILFAGLYIAIIGFQGFEINKGDAIVISASLVLGFTNVFSKILMRDYSSKLVADSRLIAGGAFFLLLGFILSGTNTLVTSAGLWPLLAGFLFWVTIQLFFKAIELINPTEAIVLANSHPVFTPIVGVLLLSEPYSITKAAGTALIIFSIYQINK